MGRAAVRKAVTEWLATAPMPTLGNVLRARPKTITPAMFMPSVGAGSKSVIVVHLSHDNETRAALGGKNSGEKFDKHTVALEIIFQSTKGAMEAQDDHDDLIDAIKARLRADRNLGAPMVIWQAPDKSGYDLQFAEPVLGNQTVLIAAVLTFQALEYIMA
jgi:hypothetical protein